MTMPESGGERTADLAPAAAARDLPAEPLRRSAMPPGAPLRLGRLEWYRDGCSGRPTVCVVIHCPRCGQPHRHPWRWDWSGPDVVSFQAARCWRGTRVPYWIALDPRAVRENAAVHTEAHAAYLVWKAAEDALSGDDKRLRNAAIRARRRAVRAERRAAETPAPVVAAAVAPAPAAPAPPPIGFHRPPAGPGAVKRG